MFDKTYVDACLSGDALLDDVDLYIEYWHTHETNRTLPAFLGMTEYEYGQWISSGEDVVLRDIIAARDGNIDFKEYADMSDESRIAARSFEVDVVEKLKKDDEDSRQ